MKSLSEVLESSKIKSIEELAEICGTSQEMINAQIERYKDLGYLEKPQKTSSKCCKSCSNCKVNECENIWIWKKEKMLHL